MKRCRKRNSEIRICRKGRVAWVLIVIVATSAVMIANARAHPPGALTWSSIKAHLTSSRTKSEPDDVTLTIREGGFEPSEITRAPGKFLLSVDNRSGVAQITLRLNREGVGHVRDIPVPKDATDWAEEIDLQAGQYHLTEVNHPNWVCRIAVQ